MTTNLSLPRVALWALALGTASATAAFAQTTTDTATSTTTTPTTAPTCSGGHHHHGAILTADELAQLKKDRDAALAANPTLQTEETNLKQQFETLKSQGKGADNKDQWQALHAQKHDFETNLHAAELAIDPSVAPILAKLEAAHGHHHSQ